jgi:peptide-methionine (S)-S-oxide reductase
LALVAAFAMAFTILSLASCAQPGRGEKTTEKRMMGLTDDGGITKQNGGGDRTERPDLQGDTAVFGGGCFWCLEAVFERYDGVLDVVSGYAGGWKEQPSYEEVCTGETGHAEVVQIRYDPARISYDRLLEIFWSCHDPTTADRQGPDAGTQYRSVIFARGEGQLEAARRSRERAQAAQSRPIVTEIKPLERFYPAEEYHQDYFRRHPNAPYCAAIIAPKLEKVKIGRP